MSPHKPRLVTFNGLGQPSVSGIGTGSILILVQHGVVSIVRVELLPPEEYGPALQHALNEDALRADARAVMEDNYPASFSSARAVLVECPEQLAAKTRFP